MLGMPRIEIEFEFDMVFCFGIRFAPYAVFPLGFTFNTLHLLKVINIVFVRPSDRPTVRPFFRSQFMNVGP